MRSHPSDLICSSASSESPSLAEGVGLRRQRGSTELDTSSWMREKSDGGGEGAEEGAGAEEGGGADVIVGETLKLSRILMSSSIAKFSNHFVFQTLLSSPLLFLRLVWSTAAPFCDQTGLTNEANKTKAKSAIQWK